MAVSTSTTKKATTTKTTTTRKKPASTTSEKVPNEFKNGKPSKALSCALGGVSATWLGNVFKHDKNTIVKRLAESGCPVYKQTAGTTLYRIQDAAMYLVKPKINLAEYLMTLRASDLPPQLSEAYWSAMIKRQTWEERAKELWRTEDVLSVFGDLAINVKSSVKLWVEEVDRHHGLSNEHRDTIRQLSDNLLETIYQILVEAPKAKKTMSSASDPAPEDPTADLI